MSKQDKPVINRLDTGVARHVGSYSDALLVNETKRGCKIPKRDKLFQRPNGVAHKTKI